MLKLQLVVLEVKQWSAAHQYTALKTSTLHFLTAMAVMEIKHQKWYKVQQKLHSLGLLFTLSAC